MIERTDQIIDVNMTSNNKIFWTFENENAKKKYAQKITINGKVEVLLITITNYLQLWLFFTNRAIIGIVNIYISGELFSILSQITRCNLNCDFNYYGILKCYRILNITKLFFFSFSQNFNNFFYLEYLSGKILYVILYLHINVCYGDLLSVIFYSNTSRH